MRLIGAKEFLSTVKAGTFFLQYWTSVANCNRLIQLVEQGDLEGAIKENPLELYIFGDNSGSLNIEVLDEDWDCDHYEIEGKDYHCLIYTDLNIVGDANPYSTLYLVFDNLEDIPLCALPLGQTKETLTIFRNWFLTKCGPFRDEVNDEEAWALKTFEESYLGDPIVNYGYTGKKIKEE